MEVDKVRMRGNGVRARIAIGLVRKGGGDGSEVPMRVDAGENSQRRNFRFGRRKRKLAISRFQYQEVSKSDKLMERLE